ncbi:MAG: hypothetical protein ACPG46_04330 [Thalassotalea sp.]
MKVKLTVISMALMSIIGCNDSTSSSASDSNGASVKEESTIAAKNAVVPANNLTSSADETIQKIPQRLPKIANEQTISLNGTKFKLLADKFEKNAQVLNLNMNEFGTVKGSFVVVLKENKTLIEENFSQIENIEKNTYRVWPLASSDLFTDYKVLSNNKDYSAVEVDIDYSPKSKNKTH